MPTDPFEHLSLNEPIRRALAEERYPKPTQIQESAIPEILAGHDVLASAQTGTGKTAAFALPMLHMLYAQKQRGDSHIRALILTPTRELALQVDESFCTYGRHLSLRTAVILGGVPEASQIKALRARPEIVVATPGRLLDLLQRRFLKLDRVETLVLDEADRMLDMGFVHDVRKIVGRVPRSRQTLFFSATMSPNVANLASDMLRDPSYIAVAPTLAVAENIAQKVMFVERRDKLSLLTTILGDRSFGRTLVFTRTKHGADRVMRQLSKNGIKADSIHSNKSQIGRQRALSAFHRGRVKVLVATDIVARGIDVEGISHVVNYELPNEPENYIHRIGRTARAGAEGVALSFCDFLEVPLLRAIERLTKNELTEAEDYPFRSPTIGTIGKGNGSSGRTRRRFMSRRRGRR